VPSCGAVIVTEPEPGAWVNSRSWKFWSLLKPCVTDPLRTSVTRETSVDVEMSNVPL
jgi:hypothetical protein